jgi:hypothetical protein
LLTAREAVAAQTGVSPRTIGNDGRFAEAASLIRGRIYNRTKATKAEAGAKGGASKGQSGTCLDTSETIATQTGVSPRTIGNDGRFAEAVLAAQRQAVVAVEESRQFARGRHEAQSPAQMLLHALSHSVSQQ